MKGWGYLVLMVASVSILIIGFARLAPHRQPLDPGAVFQTPVSCVHEPLVARRVSEIYNWGNAEDGTVISTFVKADTTAYDSISIGFMHFDEMIETEVKLCKKCKLLYWEYKGGSHE